MTKDSFWFPHDSNAKSDPKSLSLRRLWGWRGYGVYWAMIETLRDQAGYEFPESSVDDLAYEWRVDDLTEIVESFVDLGLLIRRDGFIYSETLRKRMEFWDKKREKARDAALTRWNKTPKSDGNANAMRTHSDRTTDAMQTLCKDNKDNKDNKDSKKGIEHAKNVTLTEDEYEKLVEKFGKGNVKTKIADLAAYQAEKSKTYKSHYLTLNRWLTKDDAKPPKPNRQIIPIPCPDCGALNDPDSSVCRGCRKEFDRTFEEMAVDHE